MSSIGPAFESKVKSLEESYVTMEIQLATLGDDGRISAALEEMEVYKKSLEQIRIKKDRLQGIIHRESLSGRHDEKAKTMYNFLEKISLDKLNYRLEIKQEDLQNRLAKIEERKKRVKVEGSFKKADERIYLEELEKADRYGIWYDGVHKVGGCAARYKSFEEYLKSSQDRARLACVIVGRGLRKSGLVESPYQDKSENHGDKEVLELRKNYEPWHIHNRPEGAPDMYADFSNNTHILLIPDNSVEEVYLENLQGRERGRHVLHKLQIYLNAFRILKAGGALVVDNSIKGDQVPEIERFMFKKEQTVMIRKSMRKAGFLVLRNTVVDSARNNRESEKIIAVKHLQQ
ncbi:MAG: hypothetical protein ACI9S8_000688 [Chlamydiales bacterium]|jgi:hypothetical protein